MSLPFLKTESEETATQAAAFLAVGIITLGLCVMNVMGVLAGSQGTTIGQLIIRIALAVIVCGAELLGAVILVRVMLAPNRLRKVIGSLIFIGVAWACIQNGKRAVHLIYPEFAESSALLEAKAGIAGEEAALVSEARGKAIDATPEELARVREGIAALKAEQQLMASQSPEKIKEAQSLLIAQGKYFGQVDGIRRELTEAAMRSRGEEIARELTNLGLREEALAAGAVTAATGVAVGTNPAVTQADLADRARKAREATIWLEVMLWVFEAARSFGLWALVTTITAKRKAEASESLTDGASNDVPPGYVRTEWTEDEYNEREQVWADFKKRSTAQKLRTKLPIAHKEWIKSKTDEIKLAYKTGASPQEIYDASGFVTWNEYEAFVRKIFSHKAADRILGAVAKQDDPRAAKRMDDFMPQPEPEIEVDEPETVASEPEPEDIPPADETPQEPEKPLTNGALSIWQKPLPPITGDDEDEGAKRDELV